jgi:hypothetical protein
MMEPVVHDDIRLALDLVEQGVPMPLSSYPVRARPPGSTPPTATPSRSRNSAPRKHAKQPLIQSGADILRNNTEAEPTGKKLHLLPPSVA